MPASILFYQQHPTLLGTCTNKSGDMKEHTFFLSLESCKPNLFSAASHLYGRFLVGGLEPFFMFPYIGNDDPN